MARLEVAAFGRRLRVSYEKALPSTKLTIPSDKTDWLTSDDAVLTAAEEAFQKNEEKAKRANT